MSAVKRGYSNTASGKMNHKSDQGKNKMIQFDDDVEMLSPNFIHTQTLKKPLKQMAIHLQTTNPQGIQYPQAKSSYAKLNSQPSVTKDNWIENKKQAKVEKKGHNDICLLETQDLSIKPAYQKTTQAPTLQTSISFDVKDQNSLISAFMKKGQKNIEFVESKKTGEQKMGPAETKLKSLFKREVKLQEASFKPSQNKKEEQIGEQINQSIEEDYGNQSFDKMSGAYQSAIKESIRESIGGGSSGMIKQSIRESIREEIPKQEISYRSDVKEQIMESIRKSKQSEEVYQQIFEELSISDEASKSRLKRKSKDQDDRLDLSQSQSASKGFRTKTNSVMKSIKLAEDLQSYNKRKNQTQKIQDKLAKGDKIAEQIMQQKQRVEKIKSNISNILNKDKVPLKNFSNKELLYNFRVEVNRLITGKYFTSKLKKLTEFIKFDEPKRSDANELEDRLFQNVMEQLQKLKAPAVNEESIHSLKKEYDDKLQYLLKEQEMTLRVEMDKKLYEQDVEFKRMIAELQQKFLKGKYMGYAEEDGKKKLYGEKVEVQSDYSIDSDDIEWKVDLWQVLPDYEKKKLYDKQASKVTKFLTDALMNEIKQEALERSADISFEFPDDLSQSGSASDFRRTPDDEEIEIRPREYTHSTFTDLSALPPIKHKVEKADIPVPLNIGTSTQKAKITTQRYKRDTMAKGDIIQMLSKYKHLYLRKKNDLIKKILKTLLNKTNEPVSSLLSEIKILNERDIGKDDLPYVRAYEEQILWDLVSIYTKNSKNKIPYIEQQMKRMYERCLITCQVKGAEAATQCPIDIIPNEHYMQYKLKQSENNVKDGVVEKIVDILAGEFAREMPKRRR